MQSWAWASRASFWLVCGISSKLRQKALAALKTARRETDRAYKALVLIINAMALTSTDDSYTYQEIIKNLQQTIKYYRQLAEQRRKKNAAAREKGKDDGGSSDGGDTPTPSPTPDPEPEPTPEPEPEPTPAPTPSDGGGNNTDD